MAPATVTAHAFVERRCPGCGHWAVPPAELTGVVVGQGRLGIGLVNLIATPREEARVPIATIQWYPRTWHGLDRGVGAGATVATVAAPVVKQSQADIRASPAVHANATGWREHGRNGCAWTFSTPTHRYFVRGGRDQSVLATALGDDGAGC